jgi:hypothetical protein
MWEQNLKIKFKQKIAAESFITEQHLYAQVRPRYEKGGTYNFSFQGKQNEEQFQELAR